ncbi:hypothetical protein [Jiangella mangrovi]|uniref:PBP domain-containing protein n=1 Tax=Jiangella mangrovi TaxID=1524084 RepID=A0A7W9GS34_9ACTN|nr:hypothetical protein [Jiangella mangrovi]MBB5789015.1 hypothetical protein [Jiangella mangrovi]
MTRTLWTRLVAGLMLFGLAVALLVLGPPRDEALAAGSRELTDSAVTVKGRPGKYEDFSDLEVTVSQTNGLIGQGIDITWTGGHPTPYGAFGPNYLTFMQCWGPDPDAADFRETCQFGAEWAPGDVPWGGNVGDPTRAVFAGTDPEETHEAIPVEWDDNGDPVLSTPMLPFQAAYGGTYIDALQTGAPPRPREAPEGYDGLIRDLFNAYSTNEQPWVPTGGDGTGQTTFWVQSAKEAPHLGCGRVTETQPQPQACWLVIVPRGQFDVAGVPLPVENYSPGSPLSATNWANRLVVPLQFEPVSGFCQLGSEEQPTVGTELVAEAMTSWQPLLCADGGTTFGYSAIGDIEAGNQLLSEFDGSPGLAFSTAAIDPGPDGPELVEAPVAISGMTIAFRIDVRPHTFAPPEFEELFGTQVPELKLTPRLVAKLLTQSYQVDVPGGGAGGIEHLSGGEGASNPIFITYDPEFRELNPIFENFPTSASGPQGLMVTLPNGAANREVWRWIQADPEAREWLSGTPDEYGMVVNPYYEDLGLDENPPMSFPKADPTCARDLGAELDYCTLDLRPYVGTYSEVAQRVLRAAVAEKIDWDALKVPPAYVESGPRHIGRRWTIGLSDSASTERYGVLRAALRNAAGEFVTPTRESMLAAVDAMVDTDDDGVLENNPETTDPDAYPLTMVTYAAVNTDRDAEALSDYADLLEYAAGAGQEPGSARGQLPDGYASLPDELREQTQDAAERLRTLASPTPTPTPTTPAPGGNDESGGDQGDDDGNPGPAGNDPPPGSDGSGPPPGADGGYTTPPPDGTGPTNSPAPPAPAPSPSPTPSPTESSTPVAQSSSTPGTDAGIAPYVLMVALLIGAAAAIAGPALTRLGSRFNRPA